MLVVNKINIIEATNTITKNGWPQKSTKNYWKTYLYKYRILLSSI